MNVEQNELSELPVSLGSCKALKVILATKNRLERLPSSLTGCVSLERVGAEKNPLQIEDATLQTTLAAIKTQCEGKGGWLRVDAAVAARLTA